MEVRICQNMQNKLLLLLKCCFTSTETVGLLGTGAQDGYLDFHTASELEVGQDHPAILLCAIHPVIYWCNFT